MRVYELAKELGVSSKELVSLLQTMGIAASSHMSVISEDDAIKIKIKYNSQDQDKSSNLKAAKQPEKKGDSGKAHMINETQKPVTAKKKKICRLTIPFSLYRQNLLFDKAYFPTDKDLSKLHHFQANRHLTIC